MKLIHLNRERYFAFEHDEITEKYYLVIPLSNSLTDYQEYYEVPQSLVDAYPHNIEEVETLVYKCRMGQMFHMSLYPKAPQRGVPFWPKGEEPEL